MLIRTEFEFRDALKACAWWLNENVQYAGSVGHLFYELENEVLLKVVPVLQSWVRSVETNKLRQ